MRNQQNHQPPQNEVNFCPCCGTSLRPIMLSMQFAAIRNERVVTPSREVVNVTKAEKQQTASEMHVKILAMRKSGKKPAQICKELGASKSMVNYALYVKKPQRIKRLAITTTNEKE